MKGGPAPDAGGDSPITDLPVRRRHTGIGYDNVKDQ